MEFHEFLVSRDGKVLKRYEPMDKMEDIEKKVKELLKIEQ